MNEVFLEEHVETLTVPSFLTLQSVYTMAILFFFLEMIRFLASSTI